MASKWDFGSSSEIILFSGNFNRHVIKYVDAWGKWSWERDVGGKRMLEFCEGKELSLCLWGRKKVCKGSKSDSTETAM